MCLGVDSTNEQYFVTKKLIHNGQHFLFVVDPGAHLSGSDPPQMSAAAAVETTSAPAGDRCGAGTLASKFPPSRICSKSLNSGCTWSRRSAARRATGLSESVRFMNQLGWTEGVGPA
jgi:hypothetical protein